MRTPLPILTSGTHKEREYDTTSERTKSKTVTDFKQTFTVPLSFNGNTANVQLWTLPDQEPAQRGTDGNCRGGPAKSPAERRKDKDGFGDTRAWNKQVWADEKLGVPLWAGARTRLWSQQDPPPEGSVGLNPLQQWCEAFCRDPSTYKSFKVDKIIWGYKDEELKNSKKRPRAGAC